MENVFPGLQKILESTRQGIHDFMGIITPVIENSKDDHERLYWHHIYEEEEHRADRINILLPKIEAALKEPLDPNQGEFIRLLQDISLEKFGLHNFLEHLDLSLFSFKDTEHEEAIQGMRNMTDADYQEIKQMVQDLNDDYEGINLSAGTPTDEKEHVTGNLKIDKYQGNSNQKELESSARVPKRGLTVGSLKNI